MKPTLPTNYKDDILNTSVEGMRRYQMIYNSGNTVSFKDVTPYDQTGSDFGAGDINATNKAVNQSADAGKIIDDPDTAEATTEEGYIAGVQLFNHLTESLETKANKSDLNVESITTETSLVALAGQFQTNGMRKMFYAPNNTYISDFPSALSNVATASPLIVITRLYSVYVLMEITAFNTSNGIPKYIKGAFIFTTGAFYWSEVV